MLKDVVVIYVKKDSISGSDRTSALAGDLDTVPDIESFN